MATHQGYLGEATFSSSAASEIRNWQYQDVIGIEDGLIAGAGEQRPLPTVRGSNGTFEFYMDPADAGQAAMVPGAIGALILYYQGVGSGLPQTTIQRAVIVSVDQPLDPAEHNKRTVAWQGGLAVSDTQP